MAREIHYVSDLVLTLEAGLGRLLLREARNGYVVVGYESHASNVSFVIPDHYENKPLVAIADHAFEGCEAIMDITVHSNIRHIGYRAFYGMKNLGLAWIDDSVEGIDEETFGDCPLFEGIALGKDGDYFYENGPYFVAYDPAYDLAKAYVGMAFCLKDKKLYPLGHGLKKINEALPLPESLLGHPVVKAK